MHRPKFTQRHYEDIADVLSMTKPMAPAEPTVDQQRHYNYEYHRWETVVVNMAVMFAADNASFKRHTFFKASAYDAPAWLDRVDDPDSYDREVH